MKKIYLSPEARPRPHGPYTGYPDVYEHDYCNEIARLMQPMLERSGFEVVIAPREWAIAQRVAWANANGVDYYMPIHTNAGGGTGAECLYYNHPASIRANQLVYNELTKLYPSKRGIKDFSYFYENDNTKMVSCYVEIAFHDNPNDAKFLMENKQAIAEAICKGICKYHNVEFKPASAQPPAADHSKCEAAYNQLFEDYKALQAKNKALVDGMKKLIEVI